MATVTIINNNGTIFKKNPAFIKDKTSEQILQGFPLLDHTQYILAIKTPAFIKTLKPEIIPLNIYPPLIVIAKDKTDIESVPEYALLILKNTEHGKIFLTFNVVCTNKPEITFPPYSYGFKPQEYSGKRVKDLLADLQENFELPISNPKIFLNREHVSEDTFVKNILVETGQKVRDCIKADESKQTELKFEFEIKPNGLQKIQFRKNVINEIINTEKNYCVNIAILLNYFGQSFLTEKIISTSDYNMMFEPIKKMIDTSTNLQNELSKHDKYSSCIAQIFSDFLFNFQKTSQDYFVNYNQKTKFMTEKLDSNPKVQDICKRAPKTSNDQSNITFQMLAIQPIQRFPRYPLLLKELLKYTPKSHPDYLPLIEVKDQISSMIKYMESAHLIRSVKSIQERLNQNSEYKSESIVTQDRILIDEFKIFIRAKKKISSTLYLFNDLILLTAFKEQDKEHEQFHEIEILRCGYDKFIFIPNIDNANKNTDNSTILLYLNNEYKSIEFKNTEEVKKFHDSLSELRNKILEDNSQNKLPNIKSIEYFPPEDQIIPSMINTSCSKIGGLITVFSNRAYITYDTHHKSLSIQTEVKNISHHEHGKLVIIHGVPYIYGGFKKTGPFELRENKFIIAEHSKSISAESKALMGIINAEKIDAPNGGLIYHTCCAYDKYIVVFGGKNPKKQNLYSNEVFFYSVESCEWFSTKIKSDKKPEARYKHTSVVYKNIMIIHGGISCINEKVLKDIWLFNFLNGQWSMIKVNRDDQIIPRFGHSAVIVNRFMFIIGGSTTSNSPFHYFNIPQSDFLADNFPDSSDDNSSDNDFDISSLTETIHSQDTVFMKKCVAASDCFCLNLETGDIDNIDIEGNFIHGLSQSSAIYDETNKEIVIFGGTDPLNKSINGLSIVLTLDIPTQYKSDESKPPNGPAKTNILTSIVEASNLIRKKSCPQLLRFTDERVAIDEKPIKDEKQTKEEKTTKNEKPINDERDGIDKRPIRGKRSIKDEEPSKDESETTDERPIRGKRPIKDEEPSKYEREEIDERPFKGRRPIKYERETTNERPIRGKRPIKDDEPTKDERETTDKRPIRGKRPNKDDEPTKYERETIDERPNRGKRLIKDDEPTKDERETTDERPIRGKRLINDDEPTKYERETIDERPNRGKRLIKDERPIRGKKTIKDDEPTKDEKDTIDERPMRDKKPIRVKRIIRVKKTIRGRKPIRGKRPNKDEREDEDEREIEYERETEDERETEYEREIEDERKFKHRKETKDKRDSRDESPSKVKSLIKDEKESESHEKSNYGDEGIKTEPRRKYVRIRRPTVRPVDEPEISTPNRKKIEHRASTPNIRIVFQDESDDSSHSSDTDDIETNHRAKRPRKRHHNDK